MQIELMSVQLVNFINNNSEIENRIFSVLVKLHIHYIFV